MQVCIQEFSSACTNPLWSSSIPDSGCAQIGLDTNGIAGPNILGRDIFSLTLYKNGFVADGVLYTDYDWTNTSSECNPTGDSTWAEGATCGARLLMDSCNEVLANYYYFSTIMATQVSSCKTSIIFIPC